MYNLGRLCGTRWYQHLVSLHYVLALCVWLSVESLLVTFFLRHGEGYIISLRSLHEIDPAALWLYVRPLFQCALVLQSLTALYTIIEGECKGMRRFFLVEQAARVFAVYFVAIPLLKEGVMLRSLLIVLNSWTLLNIFGCLRAIYRLQLVSSVFVEWCCHKLFLLLYPLVTYAEVTLVRNSAHLVKDWPLARSYPSPMPNAYNFQCDLYMVYVALPFVMLPSSAVYYFYKLQNQKLKYL